MKATSISVALLLFIAVVKKTSWDLWRTKFHSISSPVANLRSLIGKEQEALRPLTMYAFGFNN